MEMLITFILFVKVFVLIMAILYCLHTLYNIVKVITLKEGKVEFGKYGLLTLGSAISYIITCILI